MNMATIIASPICLSWQVATCTTNPVLEIQKSSPSTTDHFVLIHPFSIHMSEFYGRKSRSNTLDPVSRRILSRTDVFFPFFHSKKHNYG